MNAEKHFDVTHANSAQKDISDFMSLEKTAGGKKYKLDIVESVTRKQNEIITMETNIKIKSLSWASIVGSRLSILSYEDLCAMSVCECNCPEMVGIGTPNDPRLGTLESTQICSTCKKGPMICTGHLGMIKLNRWFLNPKFAELAIYLLMSVCNCCGHILVTKNILKRLNILGLPLYARVKAVSKIGVKSRCFNCPIDDSGIPRPCTPNPVYQPSKSKDTYIVVCTYNDPLTKGGKIETEKPIEEIYDLFSKIDEESCKILGFTGKTQPKDLIMRALPVIPPRVIPSVFRAGVKSYDYLTSAYNDIIRQNNLIKEMLRTNDYTEVHMRKVVRNLQFYVSHTIDNGDGKYTRSRDEPIQSIVERLNTKAGIIRRYVMGKRGDQNGRAILNPSNKINFGEVAYPEAMRFIHTTPIGVTDFNIDKILDMYDKGMVVNLLVKSGRRSGCKFKITDITRKMYTPAVGDIIERVGLDGDETMFNRQPTLDKLSIMGYKAKYVSNYWCIGLHSSYTTPHNADFDGDEGNCLKMQTLDARAESRYIASVENNIMNSKQNKPTMGHVYNSVSSAYLMSQDPCIHESFYNDAVEKCIKHNDGIETFNHRLSTHNINKYSGKGLISMLFPEDFYYSKGDVLIVNGIFKKGVLSSKNLGPCDGSLVHYMWKYYGSKRTSLYFTEGQFLFDWYLEYYGFSIGYDSIVPDNQKMVKDIIDSVIDKSKLQIASLGPITSDMTEANKNMHERKLISYLNTVSRIGSEISLKGLKSFNPLNVMCKSGAKGKDANTAQIIGCLGQQYIMGRRPQKTQTCNSRCLPYHEPYSMDISASGFIKESFKTGSKPDGFVFHMSASRIGLMDTAIKTSEIGHMHHRMVKVFEDLTLSYDGSVRNSNNVIFDYSYSSGLSAGELMKTRSSVLGNILSFVDVNSLVSKLNTE
jgi:DNA-directed RNA polymerase II subunit RPB1